MNIASTNATYQPLPFQSSQQSLTDIDARLNASLSRPQLTDDGQLRHFLGVEGLNRQQLENIIEKAMGFFDAHGGLVTSNELEGCTVMNLFFENSTRTRTTFEVAQKRLGANVINLDIAKSSTKKGESLRDTLWNLEAMSADMFVVRDIRVIAPKTLLPKGIERYGVLVFDDIDKGVADADVIIGLRIQNERIGSPLLASSGEYFKHYGITEQRLKLAKPNALVMHPGPMNRGIEIASSVADGGQSVILKQVNNGIAVRMAVLALAMAGQRQGGHFKPYN